MLPHAPPPRGYRPSSPPCSLIAPRPGATSHHHPPPRGIAAHRPPPRPGAPCPCLPANWRVLTNPIMRSRAHLFAPGRPVYCRRRGRCDAPTPAPRPSAPGISPTPPAPPTGYLPPVTSPRPPSGPRRAPGGPWPGARGLGALPADGGWSRITGAEQGPTQTGHPHMARPVSPYRSQNP